MKRILPLSVILLVTAFGYFYASREGLAMAFLLGAFALLFFDLWPLSFPAMAGFLGLRKGPEFPAWLFAGALGGIALAMVYRVYLETGWHPSRLTPFFITAMGIGAAEELLFRGYIYGAFSKKVLWAIGLSALAHTLYKTAIFIPYPEMALWSLALLTFLTGLLLGWMRWRSGSLWPAVLFHAAFDLWVYGDHYSPWWVW